MLPILARAAGGAMARKMMGRKTNVRVGQTQPQSSNAIVKSEKFTGRSTKASTALVRPPAPMKQISGGTVSKDDPLKVIHVKTLQIESILVGTLASEKAELKRKKSDFRNQSRQDQEDKLEKKDLKPDKKMKMPKVPGTGGIFGWIRKFIGNILMGIFLIKMIDHVDKLKGIVMVLGRAADFISEVGIKLVDGFATFVDWGYKAYDATQGFLKNFGVQPELFDQFSGALSGLIDALIIGSVILAARGEDGFGPGGLDKARRPGGRKPGVTTGRGGQLRGRFTNPFRRGPRVTQGGGRRLPGAPVTQGRGTPRLPGTRGPRGGLKVPRLPRLPFGGVARNLAGPFINTLLAIWDFSSRKSAGQTNVQAGVGTGGGILGSIAGAALAATLFPEPLSSAAGLLTLGILGSLGYALGGAGADKLTGADQVGQYQEGGRVRKPIKRSIGGKKKKAKVKNIIRRPSKERLLETPPKVDPKEPTAVTKSRAWWDFLGWAGTGGQKIDLPTQELTDKVTDVGNKLGRDDYFGPLLRSTSKIILDQEITSSDVRNVGLGINYLIAQGLQKGRIERALKAYSEGGDVSSLVGGLDVTSWVEDTFRKTAKASMRTPNLNMSTGTSTGTGTDTGTDTTTTSGGFSPSSSSAVFGTAEQKKMLDTISWAEGTGKGYGVVYGGGVSPELAEGKMTISEVLEFMKTSPLYKRDAYNSDATGRYQFMSYTLKEEAKIQGIPLDTLWTPELQDKMILARISGMRGVTADKLKNEGMSDDVIDKLALEFASFPNVTPDNTASGHSPERYGYGTSYYGQGGKKADDIKAYYGQATGEGSKITQPGSSQPANSNISPSISSGSGGTFERSARGTKLAGDLGRYIYKTLTPQAKAADGVGDFSYASEHPDFGGSFKRSYESWHNYDRAIDIGGFWPQDQKKILAKVMEFNQKHGVQPVELLYGKPGTPKAGTHGDHVHVAYEKGGMTLDRPHLAMIGEKGREIVIDNDSSVAEVTPMLLAINAAKNKEGVLDAIRDYAPYDERSNQVVIIDDSDSKNMQDTGDQGGSAMILPLGGTSYDNSFDFLDYQG